MERVRLACVRHAASVRPEPGSNSPSRLRPVPLPKERSRPRIRELPCSDSNHDNHRPVTPSAGVPNLRLLRIDVQPERHRRTGAHGLPALAFGSHYSVFKERPGTHQPKPVLVPGVPEGAPDGIEPPEGFLRLPEGRGTAVPTGQLPYQTRERIVNAPGASLAHRRRARWAPAIDARGPTQESVAGHPPRRVDARRRSGPVPALAGASAPTGGMR